MRQPTQNWIMRTSEGPKWQNFRKRFSFSINGEICCIVKTKVCLVIFLCCEHAAWYFLFLSLFGFTSQQYTSNTKKKFFKDFCRPGRAENRSRGDSQTKDRKTPKTRWKRFYFRNGFGTVPGVYEATTIAHRTPPALAVTTVGGTCGVLKTSFWPNIASSLPTSSWPW